MIVTTRQIDENCENYKDENEEETESESERKIKRRRKTMQTTKFVNYTKGKP